MIAKPAAWRFALAPPPEPAANGGRTEHAHRISTGLPRDVDGVAVRAVDGAARGRWDRDAVHEHGVAELNLIVPVTTLRCEIVLGDERYTIDGPASIVVPPGLAHSVNVKAGTGFFVTVALGARPVSRIVDA
jgi:hypothetical protein